MSNKNMSLIIEGLVKESVTSFVRFKGYALTKDLGNVKKGTIFYCSDFDKETVTLYRRDDNKYTIKLPISFAREILGDVSGLERGKTYTLKMDIPYERAEEMLHWEISKDWIEKFTKKFKGEDWVVFPKGTKFKYTGEDMVGDNFLVDGEEIIISDVEGFEYVTNKSIKGYEDIFKI